jgi:hypothetical protein
MGLFGTPWDGGKLASDQEVVGSSPTGGASLVSGLDWSPPASHPCPITRMTLASAHGFGRAREVPDDERNHPAAARRSFLDLRHYPLCSLLMIYIDLAADDFKRVHATRSQLDSL